MELVKLEDYNHIYAVDTFAKEYKGLFGKSKKDYTSYKQILETNLRILDRVDLQQALTYLQFESWRMKNCIPYGMLVKATQG